MNEQAVQPEVGTTTGLTQWQRVVFTFTATSKTFEDIKRGNRSWWMPYLIMIVIGYIFFAAVTTKIGWNQVAQNAIHMDQKAEERLQQAPPEQRETTMKITRYSMQGGFAASPILVLIVVALASLVLWGTINFAFGGKAQFGSIFAVWMYGSLPGVIKTLLGTVVVYAGMAPESFNINNFAPTNLGAFMNPLDTNPALYKLAPPSTSQRSGAWCFCRLGLQLSPASSAVRATSPSSDGGRSSPSVQWDGQPSWASSKRSKTKRRASQDARRIV